MNPHNPLADIYTPKEMVGFLEFAKRYSAFRPLWNSATCSSLKGSFQKGIFPQHAHKKSSFFVTKTAVPCVEY